VETIDTTLQTRDRRRLSVRLHALTKDPSVVIAAEDLTRLYAVEQRLREAQRLEAVGRVASDAAVTCDTLLRDVSDGGQQWLARLELPTAARADIGGLASDKPGMDLSPLVALISDLGGHLWMSAEPAGNMTAQIYLPERTVDHAMKTPARESRFNRSRQLIKWFRH
jgi:hypothetical protein